MKGGIEGISEKVEVGKIKSQFRIVEASKKGADDSSNLEKLFQPMDYIVRLYILEAYNIVPTDADGSSNPYVRITCSGKTLVKDVKKDVQNTSRPSFYKCYEVTVSYPSKIISERKKAGC